MGQYQQIAKFEGRNVFHKNNFYYYYYFKNIQL